MRWDNIMERDLVPWIDEDSFHPPLITLRPSRASKLAKISTWLGGTLVLNCELGVGSRLSRGNGNGMGWGDVSLYVTDWLSGFSAGLLCTKVRWVGGIGVFSVCHAQGRKGLDPSSQ